MTDAERALIRMDGASKRLNGTMNSAQLQTGRLGSQFANLTTHIAGVHPVVGNLAQVMGNFAIGGAVTAGVLVGVGALAVVWDRLTKATREATKAQNDAIASIEKAAALKILGPGGQTVADVDLARKKAASLKDQIVAMEALIVKGALDADVVASNLIVQAKINKLYIERQRALDRIAEGESIVKERVTATLDTTIPKVLKLKDTFNEVRDVAEEYALQQQIAALKLKMVLDELQKIADLHAEIAGQAGFTGMPNVSMPFEGLDRNEKKQLQELGVLTDTTEESGNKIRDAIWGSATQMTNQIVGALNIGGGGKGSNLGGAIGGTAGFALGFAFGGGPVGGAIGSLVGNIAGSFLGGQFDSQKKALNSNTLATIANTKVMEQMLNAPSGFRSEPYRYDASDPRALSAFNRYVGANAARGGNRPLIQGV